MNRSPERANDIVALDLPRQEGCPVWPCLDEIAGIAPSGAPAWVSGHGRRTLEIEVPELAGELLRVHLIGVFALDAGDEPGGELGASLQLLVGNECLFSHGLVGGRHYVDAVSEAHRCALLGDGTSVETVGEVAVLGGSARVDLLTIDVSPGMRPKTLRFRDMGGPSSFVVFDVALESQRAPGCPFKARSGGVSLSELAAVVRVGDRLKLAKALRQLEEGILVTADLDEARGEALTFLAVITAATIEMGGPRDLHRLQLEAARVFDRIGSQEGIAREARRLVMELAEPLFAAATNPSAQLIDRALAIVERHYAKDISDAAVASQLGLSTSHFRFLFKQATGQPFHKYLVSLRLEKARQLLLDRQMAVSQVATAVGFTGLSHFSRAFSQRFSTSPTGLRRQAS